MNCEEGEILNFLHSFANPISGFPAFQNGRLGMGPNSLSEYLACLFECVSKNEPFRMLSL